MAEEHFSLSFALTLNITGSRWHTARPGAFRIIQILPDHLADIVQFRRPFSCLKGKSARECNDCNKLFKSLRTTCWVAMLGVVKRFSPWWGPGLNNFSQPWWSVCCVFETCSYLMADQTNFRLILTLLTKVFPWAVWLWISRRLNTRVGLKFNFGISWRHLALDNGDFHVACMAGGNISED